MARDIAKAARPIDQLGARVQEHGRIRFGEKGRSSKGVEIPKVLKVWRFTSPDEEAIRSIAELYGGTPQPWSDPKANPQNQWEVKTTSASIRVLLPPGGLSIWYELWSGRGCQRRCDGETAEVLTSNPNDPYKQVPCLCNVNGHMECKPKTRLNVLLPEIRMAGVWRMETGSWSAAEELPAMENMLQIIQTYGVLEARLVLREQSTASGSKKFVVPKLEFNESTERMIDGLSTMVGLPSAGQDSTEVGPAAPRAAIGPADTWVDDALHHEPQAETIEDPQDDIIDAEVIEEEPPSKPGAARAKMHALIGETSKTHDIKRDPLRNAIVSTITRGQQTSSRELTAEQVSQIIDYLEEVKAGVRTIHLEGMTVKMPRKEPA